MSELTFNAELTWSATDGAGVGEIQTDGFTLELSGPESMGGRGVGTNPEELLVGAVSSCFTATLFGVLRRAQLPVDSAGGGCQRDRDRLSRSCPVCGNRGQPDDPGRRRRAPGGVRSGGEYRPRSLLHRPCART